MREHTVRIHVTDLLRLYDKAIRKKFGYGNMTHVKINSIMNTFFNDYLQY